MSVTFSDRLKEFRTSKGLSQKSLGEKTGLSEGSIQSYELQLRKPTLDALTSLSDFFEVTIDYLVGRSDDPTKH